MANKNDNSIVFNGTNSDVTVTGFKVNATAFSVCFWYKPTAAVLNARVMDQQDSGPANAWAIIHATGGDPNVQFVIRNAGSTVAGITSTNMVLNAWNYVAVTYAVNEVKLYVNGIQQGVTDNNATMTDSTAVLTIGKRSGSAANYATGNICGVQIYNRTLTGSEVRKLFVDKGMLVGCVVRLRMDEGTGSTANDTAGSGKSGALTNATWSTDVPYLLGQRNSPEGPRVNINLNPSPYVIFDGVDDYIDLNSGTIVPDALGTFSAFAWVYRAGQGIRAIIANQRDGTTTGFNFKMSNGAPNKLEFTFWNASASSRGWISNNTIPEGRWVFVGVTFDGNVCRFYMDGTEMQKETLVTAATIKQNSADNIRIGHRAAAGAGNEFFSTRMARVALWSIVLTNAQIQAMYLTNVYPTASMLGYWKLNEGTGTTANDSSGNGNNGTLTNGPTWGV